MKNLFLSIEKAFGHFGKAAIAGFAILAFSATNQAMAQSNMAVATGDMISTVDLVEVNWKSQEEFAKIVASERAIASQKKAIAAEVVLYTGYDRMLSHMQADLLLKLPLDGMANAAYQKVLADAPSDPILQDLVVPDFAILYAALVTKLSVF